MGVSQSEPSACVLNEPSLSVALARSILPCDFFYAGKRQRLLEEMVLEHLFRPWCFSLAIRGS